MPVPSSQPKIRVEESSRKEGITIAELAEFIDKVRAKPESMQTRKSGRHLGLEAGTKGPERVRDPLP